MMHSTRISIALALSAATLADAPASATVITALPNAETTDWTRGAMTLGNTGIDLQGRTVFETSAYSGNWFGWGVWYANTPDWTMGSSTQGNYLSMTASFQSNRYGFASQDWTAYFYDDQYGVEMRFNPTNCNYNEMACYDVPHQTGVRLRFAGATDGSFRDEFVELDTSKFNTYEVLLKDGLVSYRINGVSYTDTAYRSSPGKLLVIGDESAPTPTGQGVMVLKSILFNTAPEQSLLATDAPEPASWAMMVGGFGLIGAALRSRRRTALAQ